MAQNPIISQLDPAQMIRRCYEEANDRIRVDAEVTANFAGAQEVIISHVDDSIRLGDGISLVTTTTIGSDVGLDVNVINPISATLTGEVNIKAPTGPFEITVGTATDTAADPLPTPLTDRVSISIRNKGLVTIYFGKDASVTADNSATGGWEIGAGEDFNIDLDDTQNFYLITEPTEIAVYKILEIAST